MLPVVMDYNSEHSPERYMMIADAMGWMWKDKEPLEAAKEAVDASHQIEIGNRAYGNTEGLQCARRAGEAHGQWWN